MKIKITEYVSLCVKYMKTQKLKVLLLTFLIASNIGLLIINPQITRYFIDQATQGSVPRNLMIAAIMYIGIAVMQQGLGICTTFLGENIAWKATNDLRIDLIEHCISLDMSFHKAHKPGELLERVDGDVSSLFSLFSGVGLNIINNILLLGGILVVLFLEDWRVGIALSVYAFAAIQLLWHVKSSTQGKWVEVSKSNAEFYGFIGEQISSTEDIVSCGSREYVMDKFYQMVRKIFPKVRAANLTWATMHSAAFAIFAAGNIITFALSAYLWGQGAISVGAVYLIFNYTELLRRPIEQIRVDLQELQVASGSIVRVKELFDIESKIKDTADTVRLEKLSDITLDKVSFEYEQGVTVLKDLTFKVGQGRILGVLGHTGSGKTTLARLLVRLYDVTSGDILIDNNKLTEISIESLRENIAYVTQDVQMFSGTVRDNITLFNKNVSDASILKVIDDMELNQWFGKLPEGLDTMIGANGSSLAAGEKQLLAFVRIFLKDPRIIILDEATSRIDPITERLIEQTLNKLLKNRTCIIIAHRLQTLDRADDILVLENGEMVEFGDRLTLLNKSESRYSELLINGIEEVLA